MNRDLALISKRKTELEGFIGLSVAEDLKRESEPLLKFLKYNNIPSYALEYALHDKITDGQFQIDNKYDSKRHKLKIIQKKLNNHLEKLSKGNKDITEMYKAYILICSALKSSRLAYRLYETWGHISAIDLCPSVKPLLDKLNESIRASEESADGLFAFSEYENQIIDEIKKEVSKYGIPNLF